MRHAPPPFATAEDRRRLQNDPSRGCAKHICGTRAPEPPFGSMDSNELKIEEDQQVDQAHCVNPARPPRRSGRTKKADG